jgi:hypothetical protein
MTQICLIAHIYVLRHTVNPGCSPELDGEMTTPTQIHLPTLLMPAVLSENIISKWCSSRDQDKQ